MCGSKIDIVQQIINKIVQVRITRSYRTGKNRKIVSYMGFGVWKREVRNDAVRCICVVK